MPSDVGADSGWAQKKGIRTSWTLIITRKRNEEEGEVGIQGKKDKEEVE